MCDCCFVGYRVSESTLGRADWIQRGWYLRHRQEHSSHGIRHSVTVVTADRRRCNLWPIIVRGPSGFTDRQTPSRSVYRAMKVRRAVEKRNHWNRKTRACVTRGGGGRGFLESWVALVVIEQIQRPCQSGESPAVTQTPWIFGPLDKNSWRHPGMLQLRMSGILSETPCVRCAIYAIAKCPSFWCTV